MILTNEDKFEFSNISHFHKMGYYGKGVVVVVQEPRLDTIHSKKMKAIVKEIAPKAKVIELKSSATREEFAKIKPDLINRSFGYKERPTEEFLKKYYPKEDFKYLTDELNATIITSSGNYGENTLWGTKTYPYVIATGAIEQKLGAFEKKNYSSTGEEIDIVNFTDIDLIIDGVILKGGGTSSASGYTTGMMALYFDYLKNNRKETSFYKLLNTLNKICKDIDTEGKDRNTGWGIPILPKVKEKRKNGQFLIKLFIKLYKLLVSSVIR